MDGSVVFVRWHQCVVHTVGICTIPVLPPAKSLWAYQLLDVSGHVLGRPFFTLKIAFLCFGDLDPHLIHGSLVRPESTPKWHPDQLTQLNSTENYGCRCLIPLSPHRYNNLTIINEHHHFMTSSDRFPVPIRSAVKSYLTAWCCQNLSKRAVNALTVQSSTSELGRLFQVLKKNAFVNHRSRSIFWHNIWLDCGWPRFGIVADTMRRHVLLIIIL